MIKVARVIGTAPDGIATGAKAHSTAARIALTVRFLISFISE